VTFFHVEFNMLLHMNPFFTGQCVIDVTVTSSNVQPVQGPLALQRMTPSLNKTAGQRDVAVGVCGFDVRGVCSVT
jgi:hypothetical protein